MLDDEIFRDPFRFFRWLLGLVVTVYATVVTIQSLWGWYVWLAGQDRYTSLIRRYVLVHGLRLRFKAFWGNVLICLLLTITFFMLWHAQSVMDSIERTLHDVPRHAQH